MNTQFIPQQERTEEEEQRIIKQLKQSIELSHHQMHQLLLNEESFVQKITFLNNSSKDKINKKSQLQISQALVYLAQAQKILQYAAGCGKNINRQLIISVLHNQACVYQILWELDQCSNYLQALIYNYQTFFKESTEFSVPPSCISPGSQINIEAEKMFGFSGGSEISYVSKMKDPCMIGRAELKLLNYYFEHCAVSSQLQKNRKALESAKKGIKLLKNSFNQQKNKIIEEMSHHRTYLNENVEQKYFLLQNLSEMSEKISTQTLREITKSAHFSLQIWSNNRSLTSGINESDKTKQKLKHLAIGTIMQIVPKSFDKVSCEAVQDQQDDSIFAMEEYILRVFFLSVGYFSVATELRLLANLLYKNKKDEDKKNSQQYKESMVYHLIAIIISSLYIPYQCRYILDILASYSKHYSCNLQEYKPVEQQSIEKIIVLLGFKKIQAQPQNKPHQKMTRSTKQSATSNKLDTNEYNMSCKNTGIIKSKVVKIKQSLTFKQNSDQRSYQTDKQKLKSSKTDLRSSQVKKSRADSKTSRTKRSNSKQPANIKDKVQRKYSQLQKILSSQNLLSLEQGPKSPTKKLKTQKTQKHKQKSHHHISKDNIKTKKDKQKDQPKIKQKGQGKQKTERKTKNSDKKQQQKNPKSNTVTEQDEQFFFYMTKKTTKTSSNANGMFSPKDSVKSIGSSRRSTGKKSSLYSSRSNSKSSPRVFAQSPVASMQSPVSKGLAAVRKINSDKKSLNPKISSQAVATSLYKNYF